MGAEDVVVAAAGEVAKYWRDWPQARRDAVRGLSQHLAAAIEDLAAAVEHTPTRGECPVCGRHIALTKAGVMRVHNGDRYVDGWRQMCAGVGKSPVVA